MVEPAHFICLCWITHVAFPMRECDKDVTKWTCVALHVASTIFVGMWIVTGLAVIILIITVTFFDRNRHSGTRWWEDTLGNQVRPPPCTRDTKPYTLHTKRCTTRPACSNERRCVCRLSASARGTRALTFGGRVAGGGGVIASDQLAGPAAGADCGQLAHHHCSPCRRRAVCNML